MGGDGSVRVELVPSSPDLYVFFGGLAAGMAMPPFEFFRAAQVLDANRIFVRDTQQCWYHNGLPGFSSNIFETAVNLDRQICLIDPKRVVFVGNSMGGYAAILFAHLLARGDVIAFSTQTFLSPLLKIRYADFRWPKKTANMYLRTLRNPRVWDLRKLLQINGNEQSMELFVSRDHRLDLIHAQRMKGLPGLTVHEMDSGGHEVVRQLKEQGVLPAILRGEYKLNAQ